MLDVAFLANVGGIYAKTLPQSCGAGLFFHDRKFARRWKGGGSFIWIDPAQVSTDEDLLNVWFHELAHAVDHALDPSAWTAACREADPHDIHWDCPHEVLARGVAEALLATR